MFLILIRDPCLLRADDMAVVVRLRDPPESGRWQPAAWPRLAMATPGPGIGRLQPAAAAAGARALLVGHGHGGAHSRTSCEGEDGEQGVEEDVEASE